MSTAYSAMDVKEYRSTKRLTGLEVKHLIENESLDDYVIRSVEKVYNQQTGIYLTTPYTYVITFEKAR